MLHFFIRFVSRGFVLLALFSFGLDEVNAMEEARLLPKGISRFRLVGVTAATVDSKFNSAGRVAPVGGANVSLNVKDIANSLNAQDKANLLQLVGALNTMKAGAGDSLFNVNTFQDISVQQNIFGAAYEYGISDRWNIGIRVRMVQASVSTNYRAEVTNNIPAIQKALQQGNQNLNPQIAAGMASIGQKLNAQAFSAQSIFGAKGYDVPEDFETSELGYTEVGAKYLIYKDQKWLFSSLIGVRIPTGKDESLTNPLDRGTGGNYWGIGAQVLENYSLNDYITLGGSVKVDYYFADTKVRAVPRDANDSLPSLLPQDGQVQNVKRKTGALLETEIGVKTKIPGTHFTVAGAYQYKQKAADSYSGPGDLYYSGLGLDSDYKVNAAEAQVGFNTIQLYRQGKFAMPIAIEALYNRTFAGVNTPKAAYTRLDLKFYF